MSKNPFDPGYYRSDELRGFGFAAVGDDVMIAKTTTIIAPENIRIGNHVRIDGFCTLVAAGQGAITLGNYVHIAAYCLLSGGEGITFEDFAGLSYGVKIFTRSDDYSGEYLTNPTVPKEYLHIVSGPVRLARHVIIGSNSVLLPNVEVGEGSAVGALSLVKGSLAPWGIYAGSPAKKLKERSRGLLALEKKLLG